MRDPSLQHLSALIEAGFSARFPLKAPFVSVNWGDEGGAPRAWLEPIAQGAPQARPPGLWVRLALTCAVEGVGGEVTEQTRRAEVKLAALYHCERAPQTCVGFALGWLDALETLCAQTAREDAWLLPKLWAVLGVSDLLDMLDDDGSANAQALSEAEVRHLTSNMLLYSPRRWRVYAQPREPERAMQPEAPPDGEGGDSARRALWLEALTRYFPVHGLWLMVCLEEDTVQITREVTTTRHGSAQAPGLWVVLRVVHYEVQAQGQRGIYNIIEQRVRLALPQHLDDTARITKYLSAWGEALWALSEGGGRPYPLLSAYPADLVAADALSLKRCHTQGDFINALLRAERRLGRFVSGYRQAQWRSDPPANAPRRHANARPLAQEGARQRLLTAQDDHRVWRCDGPMCHQTGACTWRAHFDPTMSAKRCALCADL